jgi:hypothetical protein
VGLIQVEICLQQCIWLVWSQLEYLCRIWGFYSSDYKDCRLMGCYAMWLL